MSFLDNSGLTYFYSKLKGVFIRSVDGVALSSVSSDGNIALNALKTSPQTLSSAEQVQVFANQGWVYDSSSNVLSRTDGIKIGCPSVDIAIGSAEPSAADLREGQIYLKYEADET